MKTGLIVYITGKPDSRITATQILNKLSVAADCIEVITHNSGHFDISNAWWALTAKGMHRIVCRTARMNASGDISLSDKELRLCG
ncbi:MAG: hypothetical protein HKM93_02460 [Desulfobacteraceae bacterium]|nr:hypothetical protein [Desulfobacteraceae bacterium]